jgi:hypothetical protein
MVDDHVCWLETRLNNEPSTPLEYRKAKSSEQLRIAEDLPELKTTAGVLLVDARGTALSRPKLHRKDVLSLFTVVVPLRCSFQKG